MLPARLGLLGLLIPLSCAPRSAFALPTVFGSGMAQLCADFAHAAVKAEVTNSQAMRSCDFALAEESLSVRDRAGVFVDRGVLRLARRSFAEAKQDFDSAAALMPDLAEAYTDRGAALIGLRRYADAIVDIDRGLGLKADEPEKAYFNRALADEALDDPGSAYRDYMKAASLKPDWDQPRIELTRFTVKQ